MTNIIHYSNQSQSKDIPEILPVKGFGAQPLPCLNSNNCTEISYNPLNLLSPYHRKQALVWTENAEKFIQRIGKNRVGFLTLTFVDNVNDNKEASRRFRSLRIHALKIFGDWMLVKERQKRGAWHYHLLVDCKTDIRTGFDWDTYGKSIELRKEKKAYRSLERKAFASARPDLKSLWTYLREELQKYNFGRSELLPIRTTAEGTAKYIGKYVSKHVGSRKEQDKGVRLFSASQGQLLSTTKFSWNTEGGKEWRRKLKRFTTEYLGLSSTDDLKEKFGSKWAYFSADTINIIDEILDGEKYIQEDELKKEKIKISEVLLNEKNLRKYAEIGKNGRVQLRLKGLDNNLTKEEFGRMAQEVGDKIGKPAVYHEVCYGRLNKITWCTEEEKF